MAEGERWKPYTQRQGQLLPAFVEDALDPSDPVFFITDVVDRCAAFNRRRLCALALTGA